MSLTVKAAARFFPAPNRFFLYVAAPLGQGTFLPPNQSCSPENFLVAEIVAVPGIFSS